MSEHSSPVPVARQPANGNYAAELQGVEKAFGTFKAVAGVSLGLETGKFTTLLGPSGCGKTTCLRLLAGYEIPTAGTIMIAGRDATGLPPERRNLGMVFQNYALFPHLTVAGNVEFGLRLRKVSGDDRRRRVAEALELVGLSSFAAKKPKQLSGGQQQRVALARAIVIRPDVLLLDEPLSNLDARLRIQMRAELRRIQAETGLTVVLVTHDQGEALELSDTMVVMREGTVVQTGSPADVFDAPVNTFVAEFLGYENIVDLGDGSRVTFRPENVTVHPQALPPSGGLVLQASVADLAYRGVDVMATLDATAPATGSPMRLQAALRPTDLTMAISDLVAASVWLQIADHDLVPIHP